MSFAFPPAPAQPAGAKLAIAFRQFFYLVNGEGLGPRGFKGGVVLMPSRDHEAMLWPTGLRLSRAQVDVFEDAGDGNGPVGLSKKNAKTIHGSFPRLVNSKTLFGRNMKVHDGLVSGRRVPSGLNVRIVLSDGRLDDLPPLRPRADDPSQPLWEFDRPGSPKVRTKLTDGLKYQLELIAGHRYWLVISDGHKINTEPIVVPGGGESFEIFNGDFDPHQPLDARHYELKDYAKLHDEILVLTAADIGIMHGHYIGDKHASLSAAVGKRGTAEPICGGEEGEPDPPQDPDGPPVP